MTIGSIPPVAQATPADRVAAAQAAASEKVKTEPPPKVPFDPAPALRPTIQDKISIVQALMALRNV